MEAVLAGLIGLTVTVVWAAIQTAAYAVWITWRLALWAHRRARLNEKIYWLGTEPTREDTYTDDVTWRRRRKGETLSAHVARIKRGNV